MYETCPQSKYTQAQYTSCTVSLLLHQSFNGSETHRVTYTELCEKVYGARIKEGEMNKLDNIKCIADNFLWNNLADQFREV